MKRGGPEANHKRQRSKQMVNAQKNWHQGCRSNFKIKNSERTSN